MNTGHANLNGSYRMEVMRKAIHLFSLVIPLLYFFLTKENALKILIPVTVFTIGMDIARYYSKPLQKAFLLTFGPLLRKHETDSNRKRLNGASYVMLSATICVLLFPKLIMINAFAVLIISDLTAALVGIRFGKKKFFSKSLVGSMAFFASGVLVILFTPKAENHIAEYLIGFVAVGIGMVVEALSITVDDNLSIPLSVGLTMWLLYTLFAPALNIYRFG